MRLWHQALITKLPDAQLAGQHRECCALRGKGWGRKHSTVDYVFVHDPARLVTYHLLVIKEMDKRQKWIHLDDKWRDPKYRGKSIAPYTEMQWSQRTGKIYPEHDEAYLQECLQNLQRKGAVLV